MGQPAVACRDFRYKSRDFFNRASKDQEHFEELMAEVNAWIVGESVNVINIETIVLVSPVEVRTIRVWYRATGSKPAAVETEI